MRLLSIGDRVRPGRYRVHSRFERAVNFADGPDMVFVANKTVGAGPLTLLADGTLPGPEDWLVIDESTVTCGGQTFPRGDIQEYTSHASLPRTRFPDLRSGAMILREILVASARPGSLTFLLCRGAREESGFEAVLRDRIRAGAEQVRKGLRRAYQGRSENHLNKAVALLKGCGHGLTPAGDDFLAGCMAAIHLVSGWAGRDVHGVIHAIARRAEGGNLLSNAFLRMARDGCWIESMRTLLESIGRPEQVARCVRSVLGHGATSGADWATGLVWALEPAWLEGGPG